MTTKEKLTDKELRAIAADILFQQRQRQVFGSRFDANETPFLERQIVTLRTKVFQTEFLPVLARTFAQVATDIPAVAAPYAYKVETMVGAAKIGSYSAKDAPRVDLQATEVQGKVVPITDSFGWNIGEMQAAAQFNQDLSGKKMLAARQIIEFGLDKVIAFGSIPDETGALPALGLGGLANNAAVVTQGIQSLGFWTGLGVSAATVLSQLSALVAASGTRTSGQYQADTLLLPWAQYNYIQQTPFSTLNGDSILTVFRKNNPQVTLVAAWWRLASAGASGVPRAIAYKRSPDVVELVIPLDFSVLPPEAQGFEIMYNCHMLAGGANVYRPFAMTYGDFLTS